jgi:hypothetical protein
MAQIIRRKACRCAYALEAEGSAVLEQRGAERPNAILGEREVPHMAARQPATLPHVRLVALAPPWSSMIQLLAERLGCVIA